MIKRTILSLLVAAACGGKAKTPEPAKPDDKKVEAPKEEQQKPLDPPKETPKETPKEAPAEAWCAKRPETFGPFFVDATLAAQRRGQNAKNYVEADSSKEKPVEVCGIPAAREWLAKTKCPDGSPGNQMGRVGSVGVGGRCGTVIDKYKVGCPDGPLNVFIDIYMCGPGESM